MGFHAVYLNRVFKKEKQITPIQFLINLRMEQAKNLIREHPDWDFSLISESVGYHDTHYFSRAFKKAEGISPSEYRNLFLTDK
ncbi:MAG: helix-turn-helix transcriptional regulator [Eisenbergiella massiliensis]